MRQAFIECKTRKQAEKAAPWYAVLVKVGGGYMAFESVQDWKVWKNQK